MIKINDNKRLEKYISNHRINEIFDSDIKCLMELFYFKRNEHICKEGENVPYLFFFVEGKVKIYITLSNGKSLLICFYDDFRIIGDMEMMSLKPATNNVQAIQDTYCIGISMEKARKHLLNDVKFLRFMCSSLGEKLDKCSNNSSINLLYPLENRLASYVLATGQKVDLNGKPTIRINENLKEISELLGTSYRHLIRTFNILIDKGGIIKNNGSYEVADEEILKKLSADLYK
ncbi:MAG: cyclic nucleotide-binding domain-containing protein [Caloramator sp.]|nr:cyclic nucleotide-binding domain-containing protein [Caloramator sp.]